jgi:uncharacterized protein (TIGR02145 family)
MKFSVLIIILITYCIIHNVNAQVTDVDGRIIKTVLINNLEWTAENLNVEHYRNGELIPQFKDKEEWLKLTTGAWCYYGNDTVNGEKYGIIYNWYAVNDSRGLAPECWHIADESEWTNLIIFLVD